MATNRGILGTLLYYWGEAESQNTELTVKDLIDSDKTSLAIDYFRKLCGTCHLWKKKDTLEGLPRFSTKKAAAVPPAIILCRREQKTRGNRV